MDNRLITFLELCKTMNYRVAAENLHLTQPAVTKQIQSLEKEYGLKLFYYDGRSLKRSDKSYDLENYAWSEKKNYVDIKNKLISSIEPTIKIGVTKTIGEYFIKKDLVNYIKSKKNNLEITIENTEKLIDMLKAGKKDFLVLEGNFNKEDFDWKLLYSEFFTGICSKNHRFANNIVDIGEIFKETIYLREKGSGSREIFESELTFKGFNVDKFERLISISSLNLISELIEKNLGITFAYRSIVKTNDNLSTFNVCGLSNFHEYNIVSLKNTKGIEIANKFFGL